MADCFELRTIFVGTICLFAQLTVRASDVDAKREYQEGDVRLVDGFEDTDGSVLVYHAGQWGYICDDEWNINTAYVVCRQLGFSEPLAAYEGNHYKTKGYNKIWIDNISCNRNHKKITDCKFDGWGVHDCELHEVSGVKCLPLPPARIPKPPEWNPLKLSGNQSLLESQRNESFEISFHKVSTAGDGYLLATVSNISGLICPDDFNIMEAMVACRQLGKKMASRSIRYSARYIRRRRPESQPMSIVHVGKCRGSESRLTDCWSIASEEGVECKSRGAAAGVRCTSALPDLQPDHESVRGSVWLHESPLVHLQCAMEEDCLAHDAYTITRTRRDWYMLTRRLLRFSTIIENRGKVDFIPHEPKHQWQWHGCHRHYHSMSKFATYELMDQSNGYVVAAGHKASFCLEDNACLAGAVPHFSCGNSLAHRGNQGISAGCKDIYEHDVDCQWIDVSSVRPGNYKFVMIVNPEYKVAESTFDNNAITCQIQVTYSYAVAYECSRMHPFDI